MKKAPLPLKLLNKLFILFAAGLLTFSACSDDNNTGEVVVEEDIPSVEANTQGTMNGNQVMITEVNSLVDGWVVIHRSNANNDGPQIPEIIGKAMVETGSNTDVDIQLEEGVANDETLWAMLHEDTGTMGEYEFDGENGLDQPVTFNDDIVMNSFMITQTDPSITVADQTNQGNIFTLSVDAAEDGWIVIHEANESNDGPQIPEIIGKSAVSAGMNTDIEIILNEGEMVEVDDNLYPMLHYDTGEIGAYEFDGESGLDQPVFFEGDIVLESFTTVENTSTLMAIDQTVMNNSIIVDVESDNNGWVVVHRSNESNDGPQLPEIIGKAPIEAGMNTDIQMTFDEGEVVVEGEQLWPMVHYDTGEKGTYEFDGVGPYDQPVVTADGILMTNITINGSIEPSIEATDQSVEDNTLTISETMTNQIGFVVLHRDNGDDTPVIPESIGHGQVYLGQNNDLVITLGENETLEPGEKVWAMLHIDNGTIGSYDFDGSGESDDPPVFDDMDNIVMVQLTIQ